jgi:Uma2 family endonuclease
MVARARENGDGRCVNGGSARPGYTWFMGRPANKRATYADLMEVPSHLVAEIVDGELITSPRPALAHARASSRLGIDLGGPFDRGRGGPGGWIILDEPELHLGGDVLVPDLAGWRRERMPTVPDVVGCELAPDWLCEVVSSSTERMDRARKMPIYAREKVPHLWLVNPLSQTLEAYELRGGMWTLLATHQGDTLVRVPPFDAIELELGALWAR